MRAVPHQKSSEVMVEAVINQTALTNKQLLDLLPDSMAFKAEYLPGLCALN